MDHHRPPRVNVIVLNALDNKTWIRNVRVNFYGLNVSLQKYFCGSFTINLSVSSPCVVNLPNPLVMLLNKKCQLTSALKQIAASRTQIMLHMLFNSTSLFFVTQYFIPDINFLLYIAISFEYTSVMTIRLTTIKLFTKISKNFASGRCAFPQSLIFVFFVIHTSYCFLNFCNTLQTTSCFKISLENCTS